MTSNYKKDLLQQVEDLNAKIVLFDELKDVFNIELSNIRINAVPESTSLEISLENSTVSTLLKVFTFKVEKVVINTSDVIGVYLSVHTPIGVWRLLVKDLRPFTDAVIKEGDWSKTANRKEPLGSWDYIRYQGGYYAYFPIKKQTSDELLAELKLLFE
tara:strand:+ start:1070 stop:1543 length:474 start_codon:yes stop_codon:yes gene_type:complete